LELIWGIELRSRRAGRLRKKELSAFIIIRGEDLPRALPQHQPGMTAIT
jgi:hypothetical protein